MERAAAFSLPEDDHWWWLGEEAEEDESAADGAEAGEKRAEGWECRWECAWVGEEDEEAVGEVI